MEKESRSVAEQELLGKLYAERAQQDKADRIRRFRRLNAYVRPGQILFVGSSLMEQFPIYEFLQDFELPLTIYNRGVGGFTTSELMQVMDVCVYDLKPSVIYINIGTNDLNEPNLRTEELMGRYAQIIEGIRAHLPAAKIKLLAYYPVNPEAAQNEYMAHLLTIRSNQRIAEANRMLKQLAEAYSLKLLDLNAGLLDAKGNLKGEYTVEGMHMYANGYKAVLDVLLPELMSERQAGAVSE